MSTVDITVIYVHIKKFVSGVPLRYLPWTFTNSTRKKMQYFSHLPFLVSLHPFPPGRFTPGWDHTCIYPLGYSSIVSIYCMSLCQLPFTLSMVIVCSCITMSLSINVPVLSIHIIPYSSYFFSFSRRIFVRLYLQTFVGWLLTWLFVCLILRARYLKKLLMDFDEISLDDKSFFSP